MWHLFLSDFVSCLKATVGRMVYILAMNGWLTLQMVWNVSHGSPSGGIVRMRRHEVEEVYKQSIIPPRTVDWFKSWGSGVHGVTSKNSYKPQLKLWASIWINCTISSAHIEFRYHFLMIMIRRTMDMRPIPHPASWNYLCCHRNRSRHQLLGHLIQHSDKPCYNCRGLSTKPKQIVRITKRIRIHWAQQHDIDTIATQRVGYNPSNP